MRRASRRLRGMWRDPWGAIDGLAPAEVGLWLAAVIAADVRAGLSSLRRRDVAGGAAVAAAVVALCYAAALVG